MNIFDLRGPEFLEFYIVVLAGATVGAFVLRWILRGPDDDVSHLINDLDPYEAAYLTGGPRMVVNTALASLVHSGRVQMISTQKMRISELSSHDLPALERAVYGMVANGQRVREIHAASGRITDAIGCKLLAANLALMPGQRISARLLPALVVATIFVIGIGKISIGISRGKPVTFLVLLSIVTAGIAIGFAAVPTYRTRAGDRMLKRARGEHAALHTSALHAPQRLECSDLALALALFGPAVLSSGPLVSLRDALWPTKRGGSWDGWDSWSSCGTGGSWSGGGCGGGGCGGGGGGGCGGGGCGGCGGG